MVGNYTVKSPQYFHVAIYYLLFYFQIKPSKFLLPHHNLMLLASVLRLLHRQTSLVLTLPVSLEVFRRTCERIGHNSVWKGRVSPLVIFFCKHTSWHVLLGSMWNKLRDWQRIINISDSEPYFSFNESESSISARFWLQLPLWEIAASISWRLKSSSSWRVRCCLN